MAAPPAGAPAGARKPLPDLACSMSRAMTRPCGPEPCTRLRSTLASLARRRASGEEKMRLPPFGGGWGDGEAFGAPGTAVDAGFSAAGFAAGTDTGLAIAWGAA